MSQFYHPDTGTQPTPIVAQPQPSIPQSPPPKKRMSTGSKVALAFISALLAVCLLIVVVIEAQPSAPQFSAADQNATATANAASIAATNAAALDATANAQLSADLTEQANAPTPVPTTPVASTGVGSAQSSGAWTITVNSIKPTSGGPYDSAPKAGDLYILINFTALNAGTSAQDMSPIYFTLRDDQGDTFDLAYITVPSDPRGTVVSGQKLRGDLSYEIPKSLHSLTLQFDSPDDFDNSQVVQWNLTI